MSAQTCLLLALALYAVGMSHALVQILTRRRAFAAWTLIATLVGFAVHTASLSQRWTEAGHFPAVGLHDGASFLAWATVLVFLATYLRTRVDALGLAVFPSVFGLALLAALTPPHPRTDPLLNSVFLPVHASLAFLGFAALFVAFATGVLYLIQERELKAHSPRRFYYLAPSLETCDRISGDSGTIGFSFLTLAIITGAFFNHSAHGQYFSGSAKEWSALLAWGIYIGLIVARHQSGWGGRRGAQLGIAGFAAVVLTFLMLSGFGR